MTERQIHRRNIRRTEAQIDALASVHAETANQLDRLTSKLERERFALLMLDAPEVSGWASVAFPVRFFGLEAV